MVRRVLTAVAAALAAACAVGLVARLGMALVALAAGHASQFTMLGSTGILLIYSLAMIPGAIAAAFITGRRRWLLPGAGGLFLMMPATGIASDELGDVAGLSAARTGLLVVLGLAVYATIPALVIVTVRLVDAFQPSQARKPGRDDPPA